VKSLPGLHGAGAGNEPMAFVVAWL